MSDHTPTNARTDEERRREEGEANEASRAGHLARRHAEQAHAAAAQRNAEDREHDRLHGTRAKLGVILAILHEDEPERLAHGLAKLGYGETHIAAVQEILAK